MNELLRRFGGPLLSAFLIYGVLFIATTLYASGGSASRDNIVTQMFINAIIVIGMQIYIGNTGVLSFGHVGFGAVAGYTFAVLAISVDRKAVTIRNAPFGLSDIQWDPIPAGIAAVVVTVIVAMIVGIGLARSAATSGAIAATVITLAVLFLAHEVAVNWEDLTGGDPWWLVLLDRWNARQCGSHSPRSVRFDSLGKAVWDVSVWANSPVGTRGWTGRDRDGP